MVFVVPLACTGCSLSPLFGPHGPDEFAHFLQPAVSESGIDLSSVPAAPPRDDSGFMTVFQDRLEKWYLKRLYSPMISPLDNRPSPANGVDTLARVDGQDPSIMDDESRRGLSEQVGLEYKRGIRKVIQETLRHQPLYREIRNLCRIKLGDPSVIRIEAGPVVGDSAWEDPYGAGRLFMKRPEQDALQELDMYEMDGICNLGVRPRLGFSWMKFYKFTWEPRDAEMVHRIEYAIGPVGVGAAYQIVEREAAHVGVGLHLPLGRMAVIALAGSKSLRGGEPEGERKLLAELAWKF